MNEAELLRELGATSASEIELIDIPALGVGSDQAAAREESRRGLKAARAGECTVRLLSRGARRSGSIRATRRVVCVAAPRMLNHLHGAELHGMLDRALRPYVRAELLVIDDFAVLAMDAAQAKLAFQVISERYDFRRSTCITTNRAFKDWTKVFPDALNAQVIAERLTERSEHFVLEKSYRIPKKS